MELLDPIPEGKLAAILILTFAEEAMRGEVKARTRG